MVNSLVQKGKQFLNIIKPKTRLGLMSGIFVAGLCLFFLFVVGDIARGEDGSIGDSILMAIGDLFLWIASKFMGLTIFILKFVIEIASYNGYINSNAVGLGWILVRDITNMFFVIILMIIAFVTVLGIEQYEWKKLLVKFVLAAILVNFSRVICGVIIDAAQVFMMTFISGVAATAGGNIFNALQLNDIVSFSKNVSPTEMSSGNMVASAMMAMIFAFGTMLVMGGYLIVLLSRVIALWILIILSPLAFILGIIPKFQTYSSQWWSEFSNNVIIGPVLAFFLWLAFAVAGGGMAHSEFAGSAYPMGNNYKAEMETVSREGDEGGSNLNKFLESEQLASFLIAFFMLMAGVKVATKLGAAGSEIMGQAGAFAMKGAAMMSGAAAVKWGARTAGRAAVSGAKKAGKFTAMKAPIVGGEAWQRRGRAMKAGAKEKFQDIASYREQWAAKKLKEGEKQKGISGLAKRVVGKASLTTAQKEKIVKMKEDSAEFAKQERMDKLGMGGTEVGKHAGRRKMRAEIASEDAARDARLGLGQAKVAAYEKMGRTDDAEIARAAVRRAEQEYKTKRNSQLDFAGKLNRSRELAEETKGLRDQLVEALRVGNRQMVDKLGKKLSENAVNIMQMQSVSSDDAETRKAIDDVIRKNSGSTYDYDANMNSENASTAELCQITGLDASNAEQSQLLQTIANNLEKDDNFQAAAMHLAAADTNLVAKGAGLEYTSLSQGLTEDAQTGRKKVAYGFGANVGKYDIKGNLRDSTTAPRDVLRTDPGKLEYFTSEIRPTYNQNTDVNIIAGGKDGNGNVTSLDTKQLESISNYLGNVSGVAMKKAFSTKFIRDLNALAQSGQLDQEKASQLLAQLEANMSDDRQVTEFRKIFKGVVERAQGTRAQGTGVVGGGVTRGLQLEGIDLEQ